MNYIIEIIFMQEKTRQQYRKINKYKLGIQLYSKHKFAKIQTHFKEPNAMKKKSISILATALFYSTCSYGIPCSTLAYQDCQPSISPNQSIAVALGQVTSSYTMNYQNYGSIVNKIMSGNPIATIVIPSCVAMTLSANNSCGTNVSRWENSGNLVLSGTIDVTITSNPAPTSGNLVFNNQADPSYTLQASAHYCSCDNSTSPDPNGCQSALQSFTAGIPTAVQYNASNPAPPLTLKPCGTPYGTPQEYNSGFWVLDLISPTGQIPPAGNYITNIILQALQSH